MKGKKAGALLGHGVGDGKQRHVRRTAAATLLPRAMEPPELHRGIIRRCTENSHVWKRNGHPPQTPALTAGCSLQGAKNTSCDKAEQRSSSLVANATALCSAFMGHPGPAKHL